jgi:hypothetical protein
MRLVLVFALGLTGCVGATLGGGGDDGDDGGDSSDGMTDDDALPAPAVASTVTFPSGGPCATGICSGELGLEFTVDIGIQASGGFAGQVALAQTGAPATWQVTFEPSPTIDVLADGAATAVMRVKVPSNGDAGAHALSITSTSSVGVDTDMVNAEIANAFSTSVTGECNLPGFDGAAGTEGNPIRIRLGTMFRVVNGTAAPIRIHSDNDGSGFAHQENDMPPSGAYEVTPTDGGGVVYQWYCHSPDLGQRSYLRVD